MSMTQDFPKAEPVERGCGERKPGVYCESGLSAHGSPLETFLVDPPVPLSEGMDIANKPMVWADASGLYHLLIWIGAEHYPYVADYIEETRRYGASRRLNPQLELDKLTAGQSRMILVHPKALNSKWQEQQPAFSCDRGIREHGEVDAETALTLAGPCLFKAYDLIPAEEAAEELTLSGDRKRICLRQHASTTYLYSPTGESTDGLRPGIFAMLPISGFALVKESDGSVNEAAKAKLAKAGCNVYETDK